MKIKQHKSRQLVFRYNTPHHESSAAIHIVIKLHLLLSLIPAILCALFVFLCVFPHHGVLT